MVIYKQVNTPVTFKAKDTTLVSYNWTVNGIPESTNVEFTKTFTSIGTYVVALNGSNSCGSSCPPLSETIEITASPPPPPITFMDYTWLLAGVAVVAIAYVVTQGNKNFKFK